MRSLSLEDVRKYYDRVSNDDGQEVIYLLDAISTNVTSFFREGEHFEVLDQHLGSLHKSGKRKFRLWSAACSSGEEPYSMTMTAVQKLGDGADCRTLATDISTRILAEAKRGDYDEGRIMGVPRAFLAKFFEKRSEAERSLYSVSRSVRDKVSFSRINLSKPPFPMKGPFDAIFCRNVMIYFDPEVRGRLIREMVRLLAPDGLLFVGHSETLTPATCGLKSILPSVYRRESPT